MQSISGGRFVLGLGSQGRSRISRSASAACGHIRQSGCARSCSRSRRSGTAGKARVLSISVASSIRTRTMIPAFDLVEPVRTAAGLHRRIRPAHDGNRWRGFRRFHRAPVQYAPLAAGEHAACPTEGLELSGRKRSDIEGDVGDWWSRPVPTRDWLPPSWLHASSWRSTVRRRPICRPWPAMAGKACMRN